MNSSYGSFSHKPILFMGFRWRLVVKIGIASVDPLMKVRQIPTSQTGTVNGSQSHCYCAEGWEGMLGHGACRATFDVLLTRA